MSSEEQGGPKTAGTIAPATGKLGVMVVGLGAVATTMIAGVEAVRRGLAKPIGSLTQMGTIRLGKRTDNKSPLIKDFIPIAQLNDVVFTGWDIFEDNVYEAAAHAAVLDKETLAQLKPYLENIKPLPAVFDQYYVKRLHGTHVKKGKTKRDLADQVIADIQRNFQEVCRSRGDDLVRIDGNIHRGLTRRCTSRWLHLRRDSITMTLASRLRKFMPMQRGVKASRVRERRAEPDGGYSGAGRAVEEDRSADLRQGLQDRPDFHEDGACAGLQGENDWCIGLVLDEYSGQSRWRSARRSAVVQD